MQNWMKDKNLLHLLFLLFLPSKQQRDWIMIDFGEWLSGCCNHHNRIPRGEEECKRGKYHKTPMVARDIEYGRMHWMGELEGGIEHGRMLCTCELEDTLKV